MSRRAAYALVAFALVILSSCSEPPIKERHQAEGALAAARAADAAIYAPEPLQAAEAALVKYDEAVARRDYRQALSFAIDARDRAYEAAKLASNEKAAARSRAEKLTADVEALVKVANARLAGTTGPKLAPAAADRVRTTLRNATSVLQETRALVLRQDYRGAALRLSPIADEFRRELGVNEPAAGRRGR
jgi:hypothetical protein